MTTVPRTADATGAAARSPAAGHALLFPADRGTDTRTVLVLDGGGTHLPTVRWLGPAKALPPDQAAGFAAAAGPGGVPLLTEHSRGWFTRPALRGHRSGRDWSSAFGVTGLSVAADRLAIDAADPRAGLLLRTEVQSVAGGALRARHAVTNTGDEPYVLDGLEVLFPVPDHMTEVLDFTGRHERERAPQRHRLTDGLWLRENRRGKTAVDAATVLVAGTPGFDCASGEVLAVHVAWSGNSVLRLERPGDRPASIGGGELLLPGEVMLATGESYTTPWVYAVGADDGLDGVAAAFHGWLRSLPSHPRRQPVTLNVWEAVHFDHDAQRLRELASVAAGVGVERYVLDDGWFHRRRDDSAGLGDWWTEERLWPDGLGPLIDHVHGLGMQFGLWIEPEMVNPDSDLYRAHPDWILATGGRVPLLRRNQLVLDLTRPEVWRYLFDRFDAILTDNAVDCVKWDHNRDLLEAGTACRGGAPAVHEQTAAFYRLLDELRARHPGVEWESCAGGGGRIDLEVLGRVQRVWTSDMTDALARQSIQRWTCQLVPPEYLGAHVSAPVSQQTGRAIPLDFRAATALFGSFGVEWDLTQASAEERATLAGWVARFKRLRGLLHSGRVVRPASSDPAVLLHGVVAADRREALLAHVQLDESAHDRGVVLRIPELLPDVDYGLTWETPTTTAARTRRLDPRGPTAGVPVAGAALAQAGLWLPRFRPLTVTLIHLTAHP